MRHTTLKTRLWTAMGLMIALMVVIGGLNMFSTYRISQQTKSIEQDTYPIALNALSLQLWVERALTTISAAAFAAREDLLQGLDEIEGPLKKDILSLKKLVRHSPQLTEKINHIEKHYGSTHALGIQWVQATLAEDWNREPELSREFSNLAGHLNKDIAEIKNDGLKVFEHSINRITEQTEIVWTSTSAAFLVGFGCFIFLTFRLYRAITVPIRGLLTVINEISKNEHDFSQRVVLGANDEIGQLGSAFNRMLESLENSRRQIRGYTIDLEEKVRLRTAQLQQEKEALRESEQHLQAIWDTIPSGVVVIDRETHQIVDANPFARKLLDRTREELIGRVCHSFICPAEKGKCPITDLGQKVDGSERKLVKVNGKTIPILKTVLPFTKQGRHLLIESFVDIGELKTAQERLKANIDAAEASNQAKSEFLANMSHELRTPLNHIIGFTELVVSRNFGELTAEQDEFLKDVLGSSRHLLSLINDILDLSKVEAGKMELNITEVRLRELLESSLVMVKEKALKQAIRLSVDVDGVPEVLQADERKLKQVIYNLLSNAVKFTPDGGKVQLGAKVMEASELAHLTAVGDGNGHARWLSVWVADTGIGLEPQDLVRIFDPFEQVEGSSSRKYQGTGLGLALTKKMVELHGGRIEAHSEGKDKGAIFDFTLPIH
jgi:PAS domain S-box-containing protein